MQENEPGLKCPASIFLLMRVAISLRSSTFLHLEEYKKW